MTWCAIKRNCGGYSQHRCQIIRRSARCMHAKVIVAEPALHNAACAQFSHIDFLHLLFNGSALWSLGARLMTLSFQLLYHQQSCEFAGLQGTVWKHTLCLLQVF